MSQIMKHIFTCRDNASYSMVKIISFIGSCAMVINFVRVGSVDFQGLGIGLATVIAAMAAKYVAEGTQDKSDV